MRSCRSKVRSIVANLKKAKHDTRCFLLLEMMSTDMAVQLIATKQEQRQSISHRKMCSVKFPSHAVHTYILIFVTARFRSGCTVSFC